MAYQFVEKHFIVAFIEVIQIFELFVLFWSQFGEALLEVLGNFALFNWTLEEW